MKNFEFLKVKLYEEFSRSFSNKTQRTTVEKQEHKRVIRINIVK